MQKIGTSVTVGVAEIQLWCNTIINEHDYDSSKRGKASHPKSKMTTIPHSPQRIIRSLHKSDNHTVNHDICVRDSASSVW